MEKSDQTNFNRVSKKVISVLIEPGPKYFFNTYSSYYSYDSKIQVSSVNMAGLYGIQKKMRNIMSTYYNLFKLIN